MSLHSDHADSPAVNVVGISTIAQMLEEGHISAPREDNPRNQPGVATFTGVKQDRKTTSTGEIESRDGTPPAPQGFFSAPLTKNNFNSNPFFGESRRASDPEGSPEQKGEAALRPELPHKDDSASTVRGDLPENPSAEASGSGLPDKTRPPVGQPRQAPHSINYQDRPGQTTGDQQRYHERPSTAHPSSKDQQPQSHQPDLQQPTPRRLGTSSTGQSNTSAASTGTNTSASARTQVNIELDEEGNPGLVADYSGIVRLAEAGSMPSAGGTGDSGTGGSRDKSGTGSIPSGPTNARLAQQQRQSKATNSRNTVQNFINEQAHTVNILDPNAPTPSPTPHRADPSEPTGYSEREIGNTDYPMERDWAERSETSLSVRDSSEMATASGGEEAEDGRDGSEQDEPIVTFRFEHVATDDGHHVVVGREGMLQRCEDEPITTPGAVQGFGVLVVLEETYDDSSLVVRQVSEVSCRVGLV